MRKLMTLTVLFAAMLVLAGGLARAAVENTCTVTLVNWSDDGTTKTLWIGCANGTVHAAFQSGGGGGSCGLRSVDTVKLWESLGQGGKLSGKSVTIWYNNATCSGFATRLITGFQLDGN